MKIHNTYYKDNYLELIEKGSTKRTFTTKDQARSFRNSLMSKFGCGNISTSQKETRKGYEVTAKKTEKKVA